MSLADDAGWLTIRAYVQDVLRWDRNVGKVERAQRGDRSPLYAILETLQLGIVGTGCSGTKGCGRVTTEPEFEDARIDPIAAARYQALRGDALRTTNAVLADGQGDGTAPFPFGLTSGGKELFIECGLAHRIGFAIAPMDVVVRWRTKVVVSKDQRPVLIAAERAGEVALTGAAAAWWKALDELKGG